jgi:NAD+ kinase
MLKTSFKTIGLVIRHDHSVHLKEIQAICETLAEFANILVYSNKDDLLIKDYPVVEIEHIGQHADLVVSVGGDGTLLRTARLLVDYQIPLVGINLGRLGFLADVTISNLRQDLQGIFSGDYSVEKRFLLHGEICQADSEPDSYLALNDIILHSHRSISMIEFEVFSDGQLINKQRADGLIVTTPTGSTAYSLSGGGPIMHPTLDVLALVPICPHTLSNRPIVLPSEQSIEIRLVQPGMAGLVSFDGQSRAVIQSEDSIKITRHNKEITLLHPKNYDYFQILRAKLKWSNHP